MLFYPSHDIALANGVRHFNPPAMAKHLQEDLAYLSDIWNEPYRRGEVSMPIPWGWDYDTRLWIHRQYRIALADLPNDEDLRLIRSLSSRQTTITLCEEIGRRFPTLGVQTPRYLTNEQEVMEFIAAHDATGKPFVLKTPWSSSGRGLTLSHVRDKAGATIPFDRQKMLTHALSTLRKMGGIMGEEWIVGKQQDFAILFYADKERVRFIGYSLFDNDDTLGGVTYRQGYLRSNDDILSMLGADRQLMQALASAYEEILTRLLAPLLGKAWPLGYLGIDMLTYSTPENGSKDSVCIAPCIEMNLRATMGTVCRLWWEKHRQDGLYRVSEMQADGHFTAEFIC